LQKEKIALQRKKQADQEKADSAAALTIMARLESIK
jgi:hypothetical protein